MRTIAPKIALLALVVSALAASGCSFDSFMSPSSEYGKPGDFSQDVDSLPDPNEFKKTSADRVSINNIETMRRTESPERLLTQADEYFIQKRYHDSARLYKKYLVTPVASTASPEILSTAHYRIGFVANKKMQYQEACNEYRQALQIAPFNNEYLFSYAKACYDAGDFVTAEQQFSILTSRAPNYPDGQYYYGLTLLETGDRSRALQPLTAAKGDLEAYFLLADKRYAKGELQLAIQAENQMNQIAACLGVTPPELPHKSRVFHASSAPSTYDPTATQASVSPQGVEIQPAQGASIPTTLNVGTPVANVQPSTTTNATAAGNVSNVAQVPQTAAAANPQVASQTPPSNVAPQLVGSTLNPQLTANADPLQVPGEQSATNPQIARSAPENVASNGLEKQNAPDTSLVPPSASIPTTLADVQSVAPIQVPATAETARNVPNQTSVYPPNVAVVQTPPSVSSAQVVQTTTNSNPTTNVPQNVASSGASPLPVPVPQKSDSLDLGTASTANNPATQVDPNQIATVQNASLPASTSESIVESSQEEETDEDWDDDEFAFACSGQASVPTPTADLIASEETSPIRSQEEPLVEEKTFSECQQPENAIVRDSLDVESEKSNQNETFSQIAQAQDQNVDALQVDENAAEGARSVVQDARTRVQELEAPPMESFASNETQFNEDDLASTVVDNSNAFEPIGSPIPNASGQSFIDFRPGSTMNASLVTVEKDAYKRSVDTTSPTDQTAQAAEETFADVYEVPQFPPESSLEQGDASFERTPSFSRTYTIVDMERLIRAQASFEQILVSYMNLPTPNVTIAQNPNAVPQAVPPTIARKGYSSPEEFFNSTPKRDESFVQPAPTEERLVNDATINGRSAEVLQPRTKTRRESTPEERLQAARAAGADVIELTPEQYRQAVLFGTTRK